VTPLEVITWGAGDGVLLVHGSLLDGPSTWARQRPLAEHWELRVVQRRGFGSSPSTDGEDFENDADDLCELLADPVHVVAHAYGAIGAVLAATRRASAVRSLTLIEPTSVTAGLEDPQVDAAIAAIADWWLKAPRDPAEFLAGYSALLGVKVPDLNDGPAAQSDVARYLRHCRPPWTAEVPWERVAAAGIPTLVVSGGHSPALDAVSAAVARKTGGEHLIIRGAGHAVQRHGDAFNPVLNRHLQGFQFQPAANHDG
jgi:pimeloyl-ACP methyl ester carboxylesterase